MAWRPAPVAGPRGGIDREWFFGHHDHDARTARERALQVEDLRRVMQSFVAAQAHEPADYVEVRLSPRRWLQNGVPPHLFLRTVDEQLAGTRRPVVRGIVLVNRATGADEVAAIEEALEQAPPTIVGVDVAGDERISSTDRLVGRVFERAADLGLGRTAHAGEWGPAERIWHALDVLGVRRIAHALSAVDDVALLDRLVRDRVLVELSLGSNLTLGRWDAVHTHPVRRLVEVGVDVAFNADIPAWTGLSLSNDLELAAEALRCSRKEINHMQSRAGAWAFQARAG